MTTILADFRLGVMVADSSVTDDDRVWVGRKVHRHKGVLYGFSGLLLEGEAFLAWVRGGPKPTFSGSSCLMMDGSGLYLFNGTLKIEKVRRGIEAIGSGAKAVICAYEALAWTDPVKAVKIVCKHDADSRAPVRTYRL